MIENKSNLRRLKKFLNENKRRETDEPKYPILEFVLFILMIAAFIFFGLLYGPGN